MYVYIIAVRINICRFESTLLLKYAALAKRWKVQFRQGFAYFNNNVDLKPHIIIRTAILYNVINSGQILKKPH